MAGRYTAQERTLRRKEALLSLPPKANQQVPPPTQPAPPPSMATAILGNKPKRRSTYGLQRDYRVLEREKKVSTILEDNNFRSQLENILQGQLEGKTMPLSASHSEPNQWLKDLGSRASHQGPKHHVTAAAGYREMVTPINDLSGVHGSKYTLAERQTRCKLAAVYRLLDIFGWSQTIHNLITTCAPGENGGYFVNAFGLTCQEVTASNLVQVGFEGNVIDPGSTQFGVNGPGLLLHSALHKARGDIKCIIHIHTNAAVATSAVNCGLLPISSEANAIGMVSYLDCWEVEREDIEDEIAKSLGTSKVLILHNHGAVAMGESIEEAFSIACKLVKACEIQVAAMSAGIGNLKQAQCGSVWSRTGEDSRSHKQAGIEWKEGELEFEALMRMLDNKGYKTGYNYKGLDLLQPGKFKEQKELTTLESPEDGNRQPEKTGSVSKHKKPALDHEKNLWEYMESEKKIQLPSLQDKNYQTKSEEEQPQDTDISADDRLDSLKLVAKKVAQSTSESFQKLTQMEHDDLNSLDLAHKTAERIAKSTSESLRTLEDRQKEPLINHDVKTVEDNYLGPQMVTDKLNTLEMAAKRVAQTTGDAVETLVSKKEEGEFDPMELAQQTAERVANSTGHAIQRIMLDKSQQDAMDSKHTSLKANHLDFKYAVQDVEEQEKGDVKSPAASRIQNGKLHVSIPVSSLNESTRQLPSLPHTINESMRKLPSPPPTMKQLEISPIHNTRKLPPVPPMNKAQSELPRALSNGYPDPLLHESETKKRNQWTRSLDSVSEYSTTESAEPELNGLPPFHEVIWHMGAKDAADLKTNPLKRVSHTAEMVAESTGKAVHKLTTTLPKC